MQLGNNRLWWADLVGDGQIKTIEKSEVLIEYVNLNIFLLNIMLKLKIN